MTLKNKFLYTKIHHKGGWLGDTLGSITGGLIGNDPKEEAKKEAEKARKRQEELLKKQEADKQKEDAYNKEVADDTENIQNSMTEDIKKGKHTTTVEFSQSIKGTGKDDDDDEEEDKLRNYMSGAFRR